jgi:hypothetical protein
MLLAIIVALALVIVVIIEPVLAAKFNVGHCKKGEFNTLASTKQECKDLIHP